MKRAGIRQYSSWAVAPARARQPDSGGPLPCFSPASPRAAPPRGARPFLTILLLLLLAGCVNIQDKHRFGDYFLPTSDQAQNQKALPYNCLVVSGLYGDPAKVSIYMPATPSGLGLPQGPGFPGCQELTLATRGKRIFFPFKVCGFDRQGLSAVPEGWQAYQLDLAGAYMREGDDGPTKPLRDFACWRDILAGQSPVELIAFSLTVRDQVDGVGEVLRYVFTLGQGLEDGYREAQCHLHIKYVFDEKPIYWKGSSIYPDRFHCKCQK